VPDYLIKNDENNSLLNFSKEFLSQSAVEKQNNETINNTDFTLSGTTIVDNSFSFTLNSSDTGDFNLNINSTLKSESVGMRPPLLTAEPINSVNMQEISDNLDKIEHSLLNRKEDQKQVSSSTFKSMNKSTKHQLSSITRTPANITSSSSTDPNIDQNDKNQLFNQDSFLSSIPERGDNDIETSINIFENNTSSDGGDNENEIVFQSLYASVLIEKSIKIFQNKNVIQKYKQV